LVTALQGLSPNRAEAADVFSVNAATSTGIVDQTRTELTFGSMTVGQTKTDRVIIQNKGDRALSFSIFARFSYTSDDGLNRLITDSDSNPYDMAGWALFGTNKVAAFNASVLPGRSVVVPLQITIPKNAFPGTHSAAVVVATTLGAGTVTVAKRVAIYMSVQVPGELKAAANPSWVSDTVFYEANIRQFSSTRNFTGATGRMDDLKSLGVEALILDPIFPIGNSKMVGTLGSVFATSDLTTVNPSLGTIANFKTMRAAAKTNGVKLILTVPLDSAAIDSPWVVDHPNWFKRDNAYELVVDPATPYLADYDYTRPELRQAVIDALMGWVVDQDVDGFILSGATDVPVSFLNELTYRLEGTKDILIGTNDAQKSPYFVNSLTMTRNDALRTAMETMSLGTSTNVAYNALLANQNTGFVSPTIALNHLSSYTTMVGLKTETARFGAALGTAAALTFTLPGAPMIFQGQEVASIKALKPYDADTIVWPTKLPAVYTTYQQLIKLKKANEALFNEKFGAQAVALVTSTPGLFAFKRTKNKSNVIVVVNLTKKALTAKFNPGAALTMFAFSTDKSVKLAATNATVTIPALGYEIYTAAAVK
jgi:hypothetical protein